MYIIEKTWEVNSIFKLIGVACISRRAPTRESIRLRYVNLISGLGWEARVSVRRLVYNVEEIDVRNSIELHTVTTKNTALWCGR